MSYSSFINNPELQLQSYSLVNANPAVVPLTVDPANQLNVFLCRDAGGVNEITMALPDTKWRICYFVVVAGYFARLSCNTKPVAMGFQSEWAK